MKEYENKIAILENKNDQNKKDINELSKINVLQKCEIDDQSDQINILKKENAKLRLENVYFFIQSFS